MSALRLIIASVTLIHAFCHELTEPLDILFDTATLPFGNNDGEAQSSLPELTDNGGLGDYESQDFGALLQWINEETPSSEAPNATVQTTGSKAPVIDLTSDNTPIVPSSKSNEAQAVCIDITSDTESAAPTHKKRPLSPKLPTNSSASKKQKNTDAQTTGNVLDKGIWPIAFQPVFIYPAPYPYYSEATEHVQTAIALARQPKQFFPPLGDMITHNAGLWLFQHMLQMHMDQYDSHLNSGHLFYAHNMQLHSSVGAAPRNTFNISTIPSDKLFAPRTYWPSTQSHSSDQRSLQNLHSCNFDINIPTAMLGCGSCRDSRGNNASLTQQV